MTDDTNDLTAQPSSEGSDHVPIAVSELIGVYNANGTFVGEVSYWLNARLGRGHCELCAITHGSVREKREWRECRATLPVPFTAVHLDEQLPAVAAITVGATPCVVANTSAGLVLLLSPGDLERCAGSPAQLIDALADAAKSRGLTLEA